MHGDTNSMVDMCYKEKKESRTAESNVMLLYTSDQKDLYCYKSDVRMYIHSKVYYFFGML